MTLKEERDRYGHDQKTKKCSQCSGLFAECARKEFVELGTCVRCDHYPLLLTGVFRLRAACSHHRDAAWNDPGVNMMTNHYTKAEKVAIRQSDLNSESSQAPFI
jgi:hypothetical protein